MNAIFQDRTEAGKLLASELISLKDKPNLIVLALPRGGLPVAFEVAKTLNAPLDLCLVRKLGLPWHEELAFGAISLGNAIFVNEEILRNYSLPQEEIDAVIAKEKRELARRDSAYRQNRPLPELTNKIVILVDDGVATGATMKAAIKAIKTMGCQQLIVAIPVAPPETVAELRKLTDDVYCLAQPDLFMAIGQFYEDFRQLSDSEVETILRVAR